VRRLVADAIAERPDMVVACGGDGTIALVADGLVGTGVPLGIVPVGTGNVLAWELGIPLDFRKAARLLVSPHRLASLDAMRISGRHYLLQAGVGVDSVVVRDTDPEAKRRFGRLAYVLTLAGKLLGHRSRRFSLLVDGKRVRVRAWQVAVANAGALGSPFLRWGRNIRYDDGRLDLVLVTVRGPLDYVRLAWRLALGQYGRDPALKYLRVGQQVTIVSDRPLPVQADGELVGTTPVQVRVVPKAIRVVVPG
jgi:diacylglycerol kinase family enzyme